MMRTAPRLSAALRRPAVAGLSMRRAMSSRPGEFIDMTSGARGDDSP